MRLGRRAGEHNNNKDDEEADFNPTYGGGLVPEDNEDEIDCSKFEHLDELPRFCQGKALILWNE